MTDLRELVAKATPTPWEAGEVQHFHDGTFHAVYTDVEPNVCAGATPYDAELIVAAVNNLVPLLDRAEAAEAKVARVERLVAGQGGNYLVHPGHIPQGAGG